jgi:hypothetical protein
MQIAALPRVVPDNPKINVGLAESVQDPRRFPEVAVIHVAANRSIHVCEVSEARRRDGDAPPWWDATGNRRRSGVHNASVRTVARKDILTKTAGSGDESPHSRVANALLKRN